MSSFVAGRAGDGAKDPLKFDPSLLSKLGGLEWKAKAVMEGFLSGIHGSPFHGMSLEFLEYRDYQPGDDLRHLDWRLYARCDDLYVKRYEQETNARVYLVCDTSASMNYRGDDAWASKFECAQVLAMALSWFFMRQKDAVGLIALDASARDGRIQSGRPHRGLRYVRPSQKPGQAGAVLRQLRQLEPQGQETLGDLLIETSRLAHRRSLLVLLTDLLEPAESIERTLSKLRFEGHECVVVQVLDRDEIEFPFTGNLLFEDLESGVRRQAIGEQARETYLRRFESFMEEHRRLFRRLGMTHGVIRTDEDPGRALAHLMQQRAPGGRGGRFSLRTEGVDSGRRR